MESSIYSSLTFMTAGSHLHFMFFLTLLAIDKWQNKIGPVKRSGSGPALQRITLSDLAEGVASSHSYFYEKLLIFIEGRHKVNGCSSKED